LRIEGGLAAACRKSSGQQKGEGLCRQGGQAKMINKLTLQTNERGQYTHDAILLLQKGIQLVLVS